MGGAETTFAGRLRSAREARGLTQKAAAKAVGVHEVTYSKWESAGILPRNQDAIARAAELLSVHYLWLARGEGPRAVRAARAARPA